MEACSLTCGVKFCEGWGFVCQSFPSSFACSRPCLCPPRALCWAFGVGLWQKGTHLLAREVDAYSTVSDLLDGDLELVAGYTADDDVADGEAVVHCHVGLLFNNVLLVAQTLASAESLHTSHINRVDLSTIVCQQSSQGSSNNLTPVDDRNPSSPKSLSVIQDGVVDVQVLEDLDHGQRSAWQDGLLGVVGRIEEADVLVHVVAELWRKALDVLVHVDDILDGTIAGGVEDRVVDEDAVDAVVGVCVADGLFELFTLDLAEGECEAACIC